jgi:hypothetical protein
MKTFIKRSILFSLSCLCFFTVAPAQETTVPQQAYKFKMRATDENSAIAGKTKVILWGTEKVGIPDAILKLRARVDLDNAIGKQPVECTLKSRTADTVIAQCINHQDLDLGLFMLQNGYVTVDRAAIYETVFETPYLEAEMSAQNSEIGIWSKKEERKGTSGNLMLSLGFILFLFITGAFGGLAIFIMRGFQRVIDSQNKNIDFAAKERALKDKERQIFATMLDSEIKSNKSKIEAYLIVYDEMLKALMDEEKTPKYQVAGDIVQEQPALSRAVFDHNTDKLDVLGRELSSEVIHLFARIKTNPEYINIEPEMPLEDVIALVEKSIKSAKRLNKISDRLIDAFAEGGMSADNV